MMKLPRWFDYSRKGLAIVALGMVASMKYKLITYWGCTARSLAMNIQPPFFKINVFPYILSCH